MTIEIRSWYWIGWVINRRKGIEIEISQMIRMNKKQLGGRDGTLRYMCEGKENLKNLEIEY